jgi:hypothetical protein
MTSAQAKIPVMVRAEEVGHLLWLVEEVAIKASNGNPMGKIS